MTRLRPDRRRDPGEPAEILPQLEAAIVAPLEGREITGRMLLIAGAQRARDRTLDVAQAGVHPLEVLALGASAAGDLDDVPHVGLDEGIEAGQAIAQHTRSRRDAGLGVVPDRLLREAGDDAHVGVERPSLTGLDGDDERGLVGRSRPRFPGFSPP